MITLANDSLMDDGLATPEVGAWSTRKYLLLQGYAQVFATAMKKRWEHRVYIDLFAATGRAKIKGTNKIVNSSALLALDVPDQFDHYIFCEQCPDNMSALKERVQKFDCTPNYTTDFICGDANKCIGEYSRPNRTPIPRETGQ